MSLKLLNPGLRPLGTFDLSGLTGGAAETALEGGEYVELQNDAGLGVEGYAADVGNVGPLGRGAAGNLGAPVLVNFAAATRTAGNLGGLADEGVAEYGTLFGSLIGSAAGQATSQSGAVVIGPHTSSGSGKVTVWAQAGLYGVNGAASDDAAAPISAGDANEPVHAEDDGFLSLTTTEGGQVGVYVGRVADSSLVSTTSAAVGETQAVEYHAIWYLGNAARDEMATDDS